ncbi:flagellar hook-associated protein 2, partial [Candidatus Woesearchaeota archaeon]|nr:flagellar hook-associated protein 2 [Candidatus Woesearchaeota archaeon]
GAGTLAVRTKGLNTSITEITRQRTSLSKRMDGYQAQLYTRFNAMDSIVGKLQATSTYLTQQINALNAANKQN